MSVFDRLRRKKPAVPKEIEEQQVRSDETLQRVERLLSDRDRRLVIAVEDTGAALRRQRGRGR